jgi:hypothetical protein
MADALGRRYMCAQCTRGRCVRDHDRFRAGADTFPGTGLGLPCRVGWLGGVCGSRGRAQSVEERGGRAAEDLRQLGIRRVQRASGDPGIQAGDETGRAFVETRLAQRRDELLTGTRLETALRI